MTRMIKAIPIYNFLNYCNACKLEKKVLDCGAGGKVPPLSVFYENGYETHGIDISDEKLSQAEKFCKENAMHLNIERCDMRNLKFEDEAFSFVYSYNSIFHMPKSEIKKVVNDIKRVLKKDGLFYVNFLSKDDCRFADGEKVSDSEFLQEEDNEMILHSYFEDTEAEAYFDGFQVIYKEKRIVEKFIEDKKYRLSYSDYILKKK